MVSLACTTTTSIEYDYDGNGRRTEMRAKLGVNWTGFLPTAYHYNAQGRLELITSRGKRFHFAYDAEGKLQTFTRLYGSRDPIRRALCTTSMAAFCNEKWRPASSPGHGRGRMLC